MKTISELVDIQSKKESQALASLLFFGFIGSTCVHAAVMITPIPNLWTTVSKESDDLMEVVVDTTKTTEEKIAEIAKESEPVTKIEANHPVDVAPLAIALAPEMTVPLQEGKDSPAPDQFKPLTTTGTSDTKMQMGGGSIIAKDGNGSGFGKAKIPTGFVLGGKINGIPNGKKDGVIGGVVNGNPNGKGTQTSTLPPAVTTPNETKPLKLECLSCPKPQYRGKEGTPRVTYDIAPDGRVTNVRLRQSSGDEQTDRETIEAMSKWQFNPQTLPEGGRTDVKVRVTFEEQGSQFQRQNEERRREAEQLAEQQRAVQERQQLEAARSQPAPTAITPVNTPTPERSSSVVNTPANTAEPITTPVINPNPASPPPVSQPAEPVPVITRPEPKLAPPPPSLSGK